MLFWCLKRAGMKWREEPSSKIEVSCWNVQMYLTRILRVLVMMLMSVHFLKRGHIGCWWKWPWLSCIFKRRICFNCKEEEFRKYQRRNEITPPTVSHANACQALQIVLTYMYLEEQPTALMGAMVIVNRLLLETAKERVTKSMTTEIILNLYFYLCCLETQT